MYPSWSLPILNLWWNVPMISSKTVVFCSLNLYLCAWIHRCFSHVQLFETLWNVAHQAPLSMEFFSQEHWLAMPFSRGSALPRDWSLISYTVGRFFTHWATWEAQIYIYRLIIVYGVIHFVSYGYSSTICQERHSFIHYSEVPKLLKTKWLYMCGSVWGLVSLI